MKSCQVQAWHYQTKLIKELSRRCLVEKIEDRALEQPDRLHRVAYIRCTICSVPFPAILTWTAVNCQKGFPCRSSASWKTRPEPRHHPMIMEDHALVLFMNAVSGFKKHCCQMLSRQLPPIVAICIARRKPS